MSERESVFVRQGSQEAETTFRGPGRLLKNNAGYKRFVREFTSENPEQYEDGRKVNGQAGVVLPVSNRKGVVEGDPNPYGKVIVGKVVRGDDQPTEELNIQVLEDRVEARRQRMAGKDRRMQLEKTTSVKLPNSIPELEAMLPKLKGNVLQLAVHKLQKMLSRQESFPAAEEEEETEELDAQAAQFEEELEDLMADEEEAPMRQATSFVAEEAAPPPEPLELPSEVPYANTLQPLFDKPVRVKMDGSFGRSTTRFLAVEQHDNQLILIYDPEENIFVPSSNGEPFNLNFNNRMLQVQNVGIEFDLDFLGVGVLVFVIMET